MIDIVTALAAIAQSVGLGVAAVKRRQHRWVEGESGSGSHWESASVLFHVHSVHKVVVLRLHREEGGE